MGSEIALNMKLLLPYAHSFVLYVFVFFNFPLGFVEVFQFGSCGYQGHRGKHPMIYGQIMAKSC